MSDNTSDVTSDHSNFWSTSENDQREVCKTDNIKLDEYTDLKHLGSGSYGTAYLANRTNSTKKYVLKFIKIKNPKDPHSKGVKLEDIHSEINILRKISNKGCNPNILCYHDHFFDCKELGGSIVKMVIVTDAFTNAKSLKQFIETEITNKNEILNNKIYDLKEKRSFIQDKLKKINNIENSEDSLEEHDQEQLKNDLKLINSKIDIAYDKLDQNIITPLSHNILLKIMYNILKGIYYIFQLGIGHGDLKPDNILINPETNNIQIIDFGLACTKDCLPLGTLIYDSPEILNNHLKKGNEREQTFSLQRLQKSDIFTIGLIFYELANGKLPFIPENTSLKEISNLYNSYKNTVIFSMYNDNRYPIDEKINTFIDSILKIDPDKRPDIKDLLHNLEEIIEEYNVLAIKRKNQSKTLKISSLNNLSDNLESSPVKYSPVIFTPTKFLYAKID
jgi:serine/threonine protein kinase